MLSCEREFSSAMHIVLWIFIIDNHIIIDSYITLDILNSSFCVSLWGWESADQVKGRGEVPSVGVLGHVGLPMLRLVMTNGSRLYSSKLSVSFCLEELRQTQVWPWGLVEMETVRRCKRRLYLAAFAGVNSIVKPWSFVPTHAAFDIQDSSWGVFIQLGERQTVLGVLRRGLWFKFDVI